jgi:serine/threonine protein kinase
MAPEAILKKSYDTSVDIWSLGIIIYILSSGGRHPYFTYNMKEEEYINIIKSRNQITFPEEFPLYKIFIIFRLARNFFFKLTKYSVFERYDSYKALRHPWITRLSNSTIPETLFETYTKLDLIKKLKNLLRCSIALYVYKSTNQNVFNKVKKKFFFCNKIK